MSSAPITELFSHIGAGVPSAWAWQIAVAAAALLLGWVMARAMFKRVKPSERWKFGAGDFERVAHPLLVYLLVVAGRTVLARHQQVALLDILAAILIAWVGIRIAVYVLGHVLPPGAFLRAALKVIAWVAWIAVVLHVTGLLPAVIETLEGIGFDIKGGQRVSLWLVLQAAAALALTLAVALWIARITESRVMAAETVDVSTRVVISKAVRVAAVFLAILIALPLVGIDVTTLSVFSGALGVGLGFGLQKIAANYVSGFIVLLDRSLRIGDTVTVVDRRGEVKEIASRFTVVRGGDGVESIIPNEKLITEIVQHHTYSDPRLSLVLPVVVSYDNDVERACELLLEIAHRDSRTLADPPATARVKMLGDYGVHLELTVWVADPAVGEGELKSTLYKDLLKSFREARIDIAYPRRDVRLFPTAETQKTVNESKG